MSWGDAALPQALRAGLSSRRIPCFDGVRGLSVLVIIGTHIKIMPGHVALNFFFGLSGFLITWLLLEEERRHGRVSLKNFYGRRSLRIFPAYYAALLVIVLLVPPSTGLLNADHVQSAALYYSNYYQAVRGATHGAISPYWSLAMEEQFYLLWPGLCLLLGRHRVAGLSVLILAVWWQRYVVCWEEGRWDWAYHALDCRADHLFVGCLVAVLLHEGRLTWLWRALCHSPARLGLTGLGVLALTFVPLIWGKPLRFGVAFYLEPLLISALLLQLVSHPDHWSTRWLKGRWLVRVGELSYGIYLYHVFAMDLVGRALPGSSRFVQVVPVILLSLLLAQLSWVVVERPAQRLRVWFLAPTEPATPE